MEDVLSALRVKHNELVEERKGLQVQVKRLAEVEEELARVSTAIDALAPAKKRQPPSEEARRNMSAAQKRRYREQERATDAIKVAGEE